MSNRHLVQLRNGEKHVGVPTVDNAQGVQLDGEKWFDRAVIRSMSEIKPSEVTLRVAVATSTGEVLDSFEVSVPAGGVTNKDTARAAIRQAAMEIDAGIQ